MRCLDRRLARLSAFVDLLRRPDGEVVDQAVTAVGRLGDNAACADAEALGAALPPPEDPVRRAEVDALTARIDPIEARFLAGKYKDALSALTAVIPEIDKVAHPPLSADAFLLLSALEDRTGDAKGAETTLFRAIEAAARARDDVTLGRALIELTWVLGVLQSRSDEALAVGRVAEAVLIRAGDRGELLGKLHMNLGSVLGQQGKLQESRKSHEQAYSELEKALGPARSEVATALNNLGVVAWQEGKLDDALAYFERALTAREAALGAEHTEVGDSLVNVAAVLATQGHFDRARPLSQRAVAIYEGSLAPDDPRIAAAQLNHANVLVEDGKLDDARRLYEKVLAATEASQGKQHRDVARVLGNLGNTLRMLGEYDQARTTLERALAIQEKELGRAHPAVGKTLNDIGAVLDEQGRPEDARTYFERALAVRRAALGEEHPDVAQSLDNLAGLLRAEGKCQQALPFYERSLAILTKVGSDDDPRSGHARLGLGECLLAQGRVHDAEPHLRAAVARLEAMGGDPVPLALARFGLGRALERSEPARARELVRAARVTLTAAGDAEQVKAADAWLKRTGATP
jgi:serine/threonine-protein kinase